MFVYINNHYVALINIGFTYQNFKSMKQLITNYFKRYCNTCSLSIYNFQIILRASIKYDMIIGYNHIITLYNHVMNDPTFNGRPHAKGNYDQLWMYNTNKVFNYGGIISSEGKYCICFPVGLLYNDFVKFYKQSLIAIASHNNCEINFKKNYSKFGNCIQIVANNELDLTRMFKYIDDTMMLIIDVKIINS